MDDKGELSIFQATQNLAEKLKRENIELSRQVDQYRQFMMAYKKAMFQEMIKTINRVEAQFGDTLEWNGDKG